ncbi:hypothetical protein KR222_001178, partial [Zaprionus bogoriensis]
TMAFVVPPWEELGHVVKFKPGPPTLGTPIEPRPRQPRKAKPQPKPKRKKEPKVKKDFSTYRQGMGPLAPQPDSDASDEEADDELRAMHKVRSGRVEKLKEQPKKKKQQQQLNLKPELVKAAVEAMEATPTPEPAAATLASKLQSELLSGRFRYINEQLYTMSSQKAEKLFGTDATAFEAYHAGYRQQVEKWPSNPLTRIIKTIKRLPKTSIIGDFGCGEGKLAESVVNKVYSMDLVAAHDKIIACNITKTPLAAQSLDVAVYCLSLMGTNLGDYLLEANRVLRLHGDVYIAEIQSRFEDVREFVRFMAACGFDLVKKDVAVNYFYFFQFRKMRHVQAKDVKDGNLKPFSLKPC